MGVVISRFKMENIPPLFLVSFAGLSFLIPANWRLNGNLSRIIDSILGILWFGMVIYAGVRYGIVTAVSFAIIGWGLMWLVHWYMLPRSR